MALLNVRFGSLHCPCEFVRPDEAMVKEIAGSVSHLDEAGRINSLWDWVCRNIKYPLDAAGRPTDVHVLQAFQVVDVPILGPFYHVNKVQEEFWQDPSETLAWGYGDCEDTSILLCSLLRSFLPPARVNVTIGTLGGGGHAWVVVDGQILETTLPSAPAFPGNYGEYFPSWTFNDIILTGEPILCPKGDERRKRELIASIWGRGTKILAPC